MATPPPLIPKGMTRTVGYFNSSNCPIRLDCSALGVNFTLEKKGQYILQMVDNQPVKVNDPYFDAYLRGTGLSKEETPDGSFIPIRFLPRKTEAAVSANRQGYSGQSNVNEIQPTTLPPAAAGDTSIKGYASVEAARKAGIFTKREISIPDDFGVPAPAPGQSQPADLPAIGDIGRPQQNRPQGSPARPQAPASHHVPADAALAALDINGPPPSLEENESLPAEVMGTIKPPIAPQAIMPVNPGTGQPINVAPVVSPQQAAKAVQFGEAPKVDEGLPAPNLDPEPEAAKPAKGGRPRKVQIPQQP